ncbi:MAG TPA: hypothetical protein VFO60_08745 [Candidatus Dormibacteraeota bacterium]|nr:hypothetical protein [Candidatus Dormibacteraeota bacterium]
MATSLGLVAALVAIARPISARAALGDITTFAGNTATGGGFGGDGGPATAASFAAPYGVVADGKGNVYIADLFNEEVRKVSSSGIITDFAGMGPNSGYSGDSGPATQALLNAPVGLAIDASGNLLICDANNHVVREVDTSTGIITTVAGNGTPGYTGDNGAATSAEIATPWSIAALPGGGFLVSDIGNVVVRKVDATGTITTFAGDGNYGFSGDGGPATLAELRNPQGLAVDPAGDAFIADDGDQVVRKVDPAGNITTIAGSNGVSTSSGDGGPATSALLNGPDGLTFSAGNLYVSESVGARVRKIDPAGIITTVAGNGNQGYSGDGGPATAAQLGGPAQLSVDTNGDLFIADPNPNVIREASLGPNLLELTNVTPAAVLSGQAFNVALTVGNPGGAGTATGVTLTDSLPTGLALTSTGASSSQGTCNVTGTTVTCLLGQLAPSSAATVTLNVIASGSPGVLTNTASVTADQADPAPADNTASVTTYVNAADLSVTGTASPDPVVAGKVATFTMTVQNAGPAAATGVELSNPMPAGVSLQSASASQGSCSVSGQTVMCGLGSLGVGGSATVMLGLIPSANVAGISDMPSVSGSQADQNSTNNSATVQITVVLGVATQFIDPNNTPTIPGQEVPYPAGISGGADGNIWYGRLFPNFGEYASQIGRVTPKGVYQPAFTADQGFVEDMVQAPDGNVWFAETGFSGDPGGQSIGRITPQGKVTLFPMGCGDVNCSGRHLTVGPDGNIWFVTATVVNGNANPGIGHIDIKTGAMSFFSTGGGLVSNLAAGADGNIWYSINGGNQIGRMTPSGVNTLFVPDPNYCGFGRLATGPDHLLWIGDLCGRIFALNVAGVNPSLVTQFATGTDIGAMTRGPDAVYFSMIGPGPVTIGRATTAGVLFYSTGTAGVVQNISKGPDGNMWFTDSDASGNPGIGHVSPPPSGATGAPVVGRLNPGSTKANKTPTPQPASATNDIRKPKPPPIAGDQCADVINPAQFTVINGDVTVNDNGFGCLLSQVTINGNLHVSAGAFADLSFSTVNGSVIVDTGGQVHIVGSHVTGSVTGTGDSFITVFNSKVGVDLTSNPGQYGVAMVCGTTVARNLTDSGATDTTFPSVIGDPTGPIPCAGNSIGGSLTLSGNSEQILVHGNNVAAAIVVTNNPSTAAFDIRNNNAASLSCSGNAVAPTGGGNHGAKSGQCAKL